MKKNSLILTFLFFAAVCKGQNKANEFEAILRSGNSAKAFEFVRNYFGLPVKEDPFLHFRERGIRQLISFCDYRLRRVEATSLIPFSRVKEFWKNYSEQFTGGKWNYRSIFSTDTLAWLAANYSITLIYAHEIGHYMSLRYTQNTTDTYTCEEFLANECLAAFANHFNGNKKTDTYKKLFLELAKQTAESVPDSNKTAFETPVKSWCDADPMNAYMHLYGSDDKEFLRFYGYTQFRMMEYAITHYSGEKFSAFLDRKFYRHFSRFTGKDLFKPLSYSIINSVRQPEKGISSPWINISSSGADSNSYFYYSNRDNFIPVVNRNGELYKCFTTKEEIVPMNPVNNESVYNLNNLYIYNYKSQADSLSWMEGWVFEDSTDEARPEIVSAWENNGSFHYLLKRKLRSDSSFTIQYEYYTLFGGNEKRYSRRFILPDSLTRNDAIYQEFLLAGTNMNFPLLIHNRLRRDHHQEISFYMIDSVENSLGVQIWNSLSENKNFFNMYAPNVFIDTMGQSIHIAFTNPVTEKIYLLKIGNNGMGGFELLNRNANSEYGRQMMVSGLCFAGSRKLYVIAKLPKSFNRSEKQTKKMLIQW